MWDLRFGKHVACTLTDGDAARSLLAAVQAVESSLFQCDPPSLVEVDRGEVGEVEAPKRKRRTKAEMEAARAAVDAANSE
jgi:hypothetical protein